MISERIKTKITVSRMALSLRQARHLLKLQHQAQGNHRVVNFVAD
jgi:hypothetical protein